MPRQSRIDFSGLLHHVIVRGIEKRSIFLDDQDREEFLSRLSRLLVETETDCFAWALLDSHFHLLLQPNTIKLSHFMRRLLTGYAVVFNRRHNRVGHLFQNRYKSIVCDGDAYLLELVRYIHLNPLRAGIVETAESLKNYPWCGHRELLGGTSRSLIAENKILPLFSKRPKAARQLYYRFIVDGVDTTSESDLSAGGKRVSLALDPDLDENALFDDRILGGGDFVERVLKIADQFPAGQNRTLTDLIDLVATYYGIEKSRLSQPGKTRTLTQAKAVICYVAVRHLGLKGVDVAPELAYTPAAVSHAANRGEHILQKEPELKTKLK
jgi:putative transposase